MGMCYGGLATIGAPTSPIVPTFSEMCERVRIGFGALWSRVRNTRFGEQSSENCGLRIGIPRLGRGARSEGVQFEMELRRMTVSVRVQCAMAGGADSGRRPAPRRIEGANDSPRSRKAKLTPYALDAKATALAPDASERTMWRSHARTSSPKPARHSSSSSMVRTVSAHSIRMAW